MKSDKSLLFATAFALAVLSACAQNNPPPKNGPSPSLRKQAADVAAAQDAAKNGTPDSKTTTTTTSTTATETGDAAAQQAAAAAKLKQKPGATAENKNPADKSKVPVPVTCRASDVEKVATAYPNDKLCNAITATADKDGNIKDAKLILVTETQTPHVFTKEETQEGQPDQNGSIRIKLDYSSDPTKNVDSKGVATAQIGFGLPDAVSAIDAGSLKVYLSADSKVDEKTNEVPAEANDKSNRDLPVLYVASDMATKSQVNLVFNGNGALQNIKYHVTITYTVKRTPAPAQK